MRTKTVVTLGPFMDGTAATTILTPTLSHTVGRHCLIPTTDARVEYHKLDAVANGEQIDIVVHLWPNWVNPDKDEPKLDDDFVEYLIGQLAIAIRNVGLRFDVSVSVEAHCPAPQARVVARKPIAYH